MAIFTETIHLTGDLDYPRILGEMKLQNASVSLRETDHNGYIATVTSQDQTAVKAVARRIQNDYGVISSVSKMLDGVSTKQQSPKRNKV